MSFSLRGLNHGKGYVSRGQGQSSLDVAVYGNSGQNTKFNGGTATFGQNLPLGLTGINALGGVLPALQSHCDGAFGGGTPLLGSTDALGFCGNQVAIAGVDLIQ